MQTPLEPTNPLTERTFEGTVLFEDMTYYGDCSCFLPETWDLMLNF